MDNDAIKILVVDDSMTMRQTLTWILERDHVITSAQDGREGIERYQDFQPDIILLDINMPVVDGFGVLEHIRSVAADQETFILMLTAEDSETYKPRALNLGANDFLFKPFDRTELMARVAVATRQVRLTRRLKEYSANVSREIEQLAALQAKLLPSQGLDIPGVSLRSLYKPSGMASGDYYDHFTVADNLLRLVVADVSGHGARAAFIMGIVRTLFRLTKDHYMDLERTLGLINNHLIRIIGEESDYVTIFAADLNYAAWSLTWTNAGHCPGMLMNSSGEIIQLASRAPLVGFFDIVFSTQTVPFGPGSELFLFTDGFYERMSGPGSARDLDVFWETAQKVMLAGSGPDFLETLLGRLWPSDSEPPHFRDDVTALWVKAEPRHA